MNEALHKGRMLVVDDQPMNVKLSSMQKRRDSADAGPGQGARR